MDHHEAETSTEGEAGLRDALAHCTKHPDHKEFISVKDMSVKDLPEDYQNNDIIDLVRTLSGLTVRLTVTFTSKARPEVHPRSGMKYPMHQLRGKPVFRTGSGRIWGVRKYRGENCPCLRCRAVTRPHSVWGRAYVYTATHVVFDSSEAIKSKVLWGYDESKAGTVEMECEGAGFIGDLDRDRCTLTCVTCDEGIVDLLAQLVDRYKRCYQNVSAKYGARSRDDRLAVVVSHPHGCVKRVTFGQWTNRRTFSDQKGLIDASYTYTAATCAGSSGAPVFILGNVWYTLSHSGTGSHGNFSGGGWGV